MSEPRVGLTRLWRYTEGRHGRLAVILALAAVSAAAPVAGWHVVGDAIDNGIRAENDGRLVAESGTKWFKSHADSRCREGRGCRHDSSAR